MYTDVTEARISEVLDIVGLGRRGDSRVAGYSHGMKQRLGIAQALMHEPELVILDEPTSGLDPQGMKDVRELVRELGRRGTTVFLSSHLLHEVEQICNRAVIMNKGRIVVQGPVAELRPTDMSVKVLTSDQRRALEVLRAFCGTGAVVDDGEYLDVRAADDAAPEMVRRLVAEGIDVRAIIPAVEHGLEDFFLETTSGADSGTEPAGADAAAVPASEASTATSSGGTEPSR